MESSSLLLLKKRAQFQGYVTLKTFLIWSHLKMRPEFSLSTIIFIYIIVIIVPSILAVQKKVPLVSVSTQKGTLIDFKFCFHVTSHWNLSLCNYFALYDWLLIMENVTRLCHSLLKEPRYLWRCRLRIIKKMYFLLYVNHE